MNAFGVGVVETKASYLGILRTATDTRRLELISLKAIFICWRLLTVTYLAVSLFVNSVVRLTTAPNPNIKILTAIKTLCVTCLL